MAGDELGALARRWTASVARRRMCAGTEVAGRTASTPRDSSAITSKQAAPLAAPQGCDRLGRVDARTTPCMLAARRIESQQQTSLARARRLEVTTSRRDRVDAATIFGPLGVRHRLCHGFCSCAAWPAAVDAGADECADARGRTRRLCARWRFVRFESGLRRQGWGAALCATDQIEL